jgi:hypothetical protein
VAPENVRVPAANILGAEGQGWQVGITTLMYERLALGFGLQCHAGADRQPMPVLHQDMPVVPEPLWGRRDPLAWGGRCRAA